MALTHTRLILLPCLVFLMMTVPHLDQGDFRRDTGRYAAVGLYMWSEGSVWKPYINPETPYFNKPPMALVVQLAKDWVGPLVDMDTFLGVFVQAAAAGFAGLALYFGAACLLRTEEARGFIDAVRRRVRVRKLPPIAVNEAVE